MIGRRIAFDMLIWYKPGLSLTIDIIGHEGRSEYDPAKNRIYLTVRDYMGHGLHSLTTACHEAGHAIDHSQWPWLFVLRHWGRYILIGYFINLFLEWHASRLAWRYMKSTNHFTPTQLTEIRRLLTNAWLTYLLS